MTVTLLKSFLKLALLVIMLWLFGFVVYAYTSVSMRADKPDVKTDSVVVLTGDEKRIETGLSLLAQGLSGNLFISGVHKDVTEQDIRAMWNGSPPLPACCIVLGQTAMTTQQNGRETALWISSMQFKVIRLVTSKYHMHRAVMELNHAAPDVKIIREPVTDKTTDIKSERLWQLLFSEYNKTLFRAIQILSGVFPAAAH
jgi:uncharacterized SAM-binding protein YcdF (DUF218 family)